MADTILLNDGAVAIILEDVPGKGMRYVLEHCIDIPRMSVDEDYGKNHLYLLAAAYGLRSILTKDVSLVLEEGNAALAGGQDIGNGE